MKLTRLRSGELIALIGAIALAVLTFFPWFSGPQGNLTAWDDFGVVDVLIVAAVLSALWLAVATVTERTTALPVAAAVWTTLLGLVSTIAILVWLLVLPGNATGHCVPGWLALVASALIAVGAWLSMRDERTDRYRPDDSTPLPVPPG
jgi:hypothetical protein